MHYWHCAQICQPKIWWVWVFSIKLLSFYFGIFAITNFTLLYYFVIVMQEIRNGWCHITTTVKPDLKFPQLLTGSNKLAKHYCQCAELLCILPKLSTANYFCWVRPVSRVVYSPQMSCLGLCKSWCLSDK